MRRNGTQLEIGLNSIQSKKGEIEIDELYADSFQDDKETMDTLKREGLKPWPITFGNAPFFAVFPSVAAKINALKTDAKWLYYPADLGKELMKQGIQTCINCHSGRTVENGVYID